MDELIDKEKNEETLQIPETDADELPPLSDKEQDELREYALLCGFTTEEITVHPLLISAFGEKLLNYLGSNKSNIYAILLQPGIEEVVKKHADDPFYLAHAFLKGFTSKEITTYPLLVSEFGGELIYYTRGNKDKVFAILSQPGIEEVVKKHINRSTDLAYTFSQGFSPEEIDRYPLLASGFGGSLIYHFGRDKNKVHAILSLPDIEEVVKKHINRSTDLAFALSRGFTPEEIAAHPLLVSEFGGELIDFTNVNKDKILAILEQQDIEKIVNEHRNNRVLLINTLLAGFTAEEILAHPHLVSELVEDMPNSDTQV